jgi:hypothetical protein
MITKTVMRYRRCAKFQTAFQPKMSLEYGRLFSPWPLSGAGELLSRPINSLGRPFGLSLSRPVVVPFDVAQGEQYLRAWLITHQSL